MMSYRGKHEFMKPTGFIAKKQDFFDRSIRVLICLSTYFCPGLQFSIRKVEVLIVVVRNSNKCSNMNK